MWNIWHEQYFVTTTFRKANVPPKLARMKCNGQAIHDYFEKWELCAEQMMDSPVDQGLLLTFVVDYFGNGSKSPYGMAL